METFGGPTVLARLEQAEHAARERRLVAVAEADTILALAREQAAVIDDATPDRVRHAIERLRARLLAEADAQVAAIEHQGETRAAATSRPAASGPAGPIPGRSSHLAQAVELVVGAVLGEGPTAALPDERPSRSQPATGADRCS